MSNLRSGLNLMVLSLAFFALTVVGSASILLAQSATTSLLAVITFSGWAYQVLSLTGKGVCCSTPAHKDLVHTSLFLEVLAFMLGLVGFSAGLRVVTSLCAIAIFLSFICKMADFSEEPRAATAAIDSAKYFGIGLLGFPLCLLLGFINGKLVLLAGLHFVCFLALSLLSYGRSLVLLRNALTSHSTGHGF